MQEFGAHRAVLSADIQRRLESDSDVERLCAVQAAILAEDTGSLPLLLQVVRSDACPQVRATAALAIGILAKKKVVIGTRRLFGSQR